MSKEFSSIISWNVNSVRARIDLVLDLLEKHSPDVLMLQETKVIDELFPRTVFEDRNYNLAVHGQKSYNGVAILSKHPIDSVVHGQFSKEARIIACSTMGLNFVCVYVINGAEVGSLKYYEKLEFFDYLQYFLKNYSDKETIVAGDFNVTFDDLDVYDPLVWRGKITCSAPEREKLKNVISSGYSDGFRRFNPEHTFTWWDYRRESIEENRGLRIDYILSTPDTHDRIQGIKVLKEFRNREKPSDHAPLMMLISNNP